MLILIFHSFANVLRIFNLSWMNEILSLQTFFIFIFDSFPESKVILEGLQIGFNNFPIYFLIGSWITMGTADHNSFFYSF
jgi:hypothetical protein